MKPNEAAVRTRLGGGQRKPGPLRRTTRIALAVLLVVVGASAFPVSAGKIYWTGGGGVYRADLDGSNVEQLADSGNSGIALDVAGGTMYWVADGWILRARLDGSNVEEIVEGSPQGIALDVDHGKLYWVQRRPLPMVGFVRRANLDGSGVEDLVELSPAPYPEGGGIDLDVVNQKMYWTHGGVFRAGLDGSNVEQLLPGLSGGLPPFGWIALQLAAGKMYWRATFLLHPDGGPTEYRIERANLNGSAPEAVIVLPDAEGGIAVDSEHGKMYWTVYFSDGSIMRANLDGADAVPLVAGIVYPRGIALALASFCGDGMVDPGEICDDGNNVDGDGCASDCTNEGPDVPATNGIGVILLVLSLSGGAAYFVRRRVN